MMRLYCEQEVKEEFLYIYEIYIHIIRIDIY